MARDEDWGYGLRAQPRQGRTVWKRRGFAQGRRTLRGATAAAGALPFLVHGGVAEALLGLAVVIGALGPVLDLWRQGLVTDGRGIRIRRILSTTSVPWDEVRGFVVQPGKKYLVCAVELTDGSTRPAYTIGRVGIAEQEAYREVAQLNRLRSEHTRLPARISTLL